MNEPPLPRTFRAANVRRGRLHRLCCVALCAVAATAADASDEIPAPFQVAEGVHVVRAEGGEVTAANGGRVANVAFVVGPRGVAVIDTGVSAREGAAIIASVRRVTDKPIRLAIITHPSQEVLFGAATFQAHGIPVMLHRSSAALMAARCETCLRNLNGVLGDAAMAGTRVVTPDRLVDATQWLDVIGRPLLILAPKRGSAPGALAVFDPATRTLLAGSLASIDSVPDMRDADGEPWRGALALLAATRCTHLVPAYGSVGSCADIGVLDGYFDALETRVRELLAARIGLADVASRVELPQFAGWNRYEPLHRQNANRVYLRMERAAFAD
jgi:glyoxylase-like metal-dependent hydrolase (beta-lactamase superfamily II)